MRQYVVYYQEYFFTNILSTERIVDQVDEKYFCYSKNSGYNMELRKV